MVFQGKDTKQINGHTCESAQPESWYWQPDDYDGDVLWSEPFNTRRGAVIAEGVSNHLSNIGRKGGKKSRRSLDPETARQMVAAREAKKARSARWPKPEPVK